MANKGDIKIIKDTEGGVIFDINSNTEIEFIQPFHKELFLEVGARVRYTTYTPEGAARPLAVSVERVTVGKVEELNSDNRTGIIVERVTKVKIPFTEPLLKERMIAVGDIVRYDLVRDSKGLPVAVNVREVAD